MIPLAINRNVCIMCTKLIQSITVLKTFKYTADCFLTNIIKAQQSEFKTCKIGISMKILKCGQNLIDVYEMKCYVILTRTNVIDNLIQLYIVQH